MSAASFIAGSGFVADAQALAILRQRRSARRLARSLFRGKWRAALVEGGVTQHRWRLVTRTLPDGSESGGTLMLGINLLETGYKLHADIMAGRPVLAGVPASHEDQRAAIDMLRRRTLFDALYHEAVLTCYAEGEAALHVDHAPEGVVVRVADNDESFPVGPPGPDGQPTVWERRWIVERPDPASARRTRRWLRIERHSAPGGEGLVEHEAYRTDATDPLQETLGLERAPLAETGDERLEPVRATGLPYPLIVQLVTYRLGGQPQATLGGADVQLVDAMCASITRLARTMEIHGTPKFRVPEQWVRDGRAEIPEAFIDPERLAEFLVVSFDFDAQRRAMAEFMRWLIVRVGLAASLLGYKPEGGAAPDSFDKLRLEATLPLAFARRASVLHEAALERVFDLASLLMSRQGMGWPVAPVSVRVRADLPKDMVTVAAEQERLLAAGLTSQIRALAEVHGEDQAAIVLAEIDVDRNAATRRSQESLMGAAFGDPDGDAGENDGADHADASQGAAA